MFVLAVLCILTAVLATGAYAGGLIVENGGEPGPGYSPVTSDYFLMIGFAFFMFEGIGSLLPIMRETAVPDLFPYLAAGALGTLATIYIAFSSLCYYTWGTDLTESVSVKSVPQV
jgi:hypothetical protein